MQYQFSTNDATQLVALFTQLEETITGWRATDKPDYKMILDAMDQTGNWIVRNVEAIDQK